MTVINLHGVLGERVKKTFKLQVKSVSEAIHAINTLTRGTLYKALYDLDKKSVKYKVVINNKPFIHDKEITLKNLEEVRKTELVANFEKFESLDIVPIIEGAGGDGGILGIFQAIIGVVLIIAGIVIGVGAGWTGVGAVVGYGMIIAGVGLLAGGIITLLSSPPKFEDFREIDGATGRTSYLFNGPQNTTREGGPVPVGYGRLLVGSQVISASYVITDYDTENVDATTLRKDGLGYGGRVQGRTILLY